MLPHSCALAGLEMTGPRGRGNKVITMTHMAVTLQTTRQARHGFPSALSPERKELKTEEVKEGV